LKKPLESLVLRPAKMVQFPKMLAFLIIRELSFPERVDLFLELIEIKKDGKPTWGTF
jgi:hypothetical protein